MRWADWVDVEEFVCVFIYCLVGLGLAEHPTFQLFSLAAQGLASFEVVAGCGLRHFSRRQALEGAGRVLASFG